MPSEKKKITTEADLVQKLSSKLIADGFRIRREVSNMGQSADVVATKGRWVTVIEAKLTDWRRALLQCRAHEQIADYICIAVATARVAEPLVQAAEQMGYGIIHYDETNAQFNWTVQPRLNKQVWLPQRRHWARLAKRVVYEC